MFAISGHGSPQLRILFTLFEMVLTNFQSGERVVNDADKNPFSLHRVDRSVQQEAPLLQFGWSDQHVAPVKVPVINNIDNS